MKNIALSILPPEFRSEKCSGAPGMDHAEVIKKLKKYKKMLSQHMSFDELILYGTYAKGNARKDSDVDVAIVVISPVTILPLGRYCGK